MRIRPAKRLRGRVARLPGDKSISHRAAIVAALARGRTRITNYSTAADCAATLRCLEQLGVAVESEGDAVLVEGVGRVPGEWAFVRPTAPLDCGNSGTTMRLLAGVLAGQPFESVLTGDASLLSRPMRRIVEPLESMGARVETAEGGRAPLRVAGRRPLKCVEYRLPVASAQVKSCVLLAGLAAEGFTSVVDLNDAGTRDHTERMLEWFGVAVERRLVMRGFQTADTYTSVGVSGPAAFDTPGEVAVPGDVSAASFIASASALLPGSVVHLEDVGLNATRTEFLRALKRLGADVELTDARPRCKEPVGEVRVGGAADMCAFVPPSERGGPLSFGGAEAARMIDELPLLAVVGTRVDGGLEVRDAAELRVKESDRIGACVENLRAMGAEVEEFSDGFRVGGPVRLRGARLDSHGDHRIAMAFAVAALTAEGDSEIDGAAECVGVSFPDFFETMEALAER